VVQIWPGLFTLVYTQISPGYIWTILYMCVAVSVTCLKLQNLYLQYQESGCLAKLQKLCMTRRHTVQWPVSDKTHMLPQAWLYFRLLVEYWNARWLNLYTVPAELDNSTQFIWILITMFFQNERLGNRRNEILIYVLPCLHPNLIVWWVVPK